MAKIPIWAGTATFNVGQNPTPFGFYDNDKEFQSDAPKVADWCAQRLGYPLVDIELKQENFFAAFEEAVTEYGTQVYQFEVINNIGNLIGYETGSKDDTVGEDGEIIEGEGFNNIIVSDVYGQRANSNTYDMSGYSGVLGDSTIYSASIQIKKDKQKYNLLSSSPEYATTIIEWGANPLDETGAQTFGQLPHSASIAITDTNGLTVHYRATTGSSGDGHIFNGEGNEVTNVGVPGKNDAANMVTGSGEFRRYRHASASKGEFVTGSYTVTNEEGEVIPGTSFGLGGINGSANVGHLSASFDSFISTLKLGPHKDSFIISSSLSSSGAHFVKLTQKIEGTGGNTKITLTNMTGVTASGVSSSTSDSEGLPGEVTASFSGGDSGVSFEVSGSQILAKSKRIKIEKVYHYQPAAINRYFDPYAGTGTGIQSLMQAFGFGNYSPGVNFMLMPMYFDLLKLQAIEMNDKIRKSAYHFELNRKNLKIFPIPTKDFTLWFDYSMADSSNDLTTYAGHSGGDGDDNEKVATNLITNQMNVPFKNPTYRFINAIGRQWIRKYTLALTKEMLGSIRGKYQSVPIPGSDTTLDYSRLLDEARAEKEALITQLREDLGETTTVAQNERAAAEGSAQQEEYGYNNPYQIYIH